MAKNKGEREAEGMTELKELQIALHCMKFEAEIEVCEECSEYENCTDLTRKDVARTCISALEKQIPKKPLRKQEEKQYYICPSCKCRIYTNCDIRELNFCFNCGQAILMSESEEMELVE